MLKRSFVSALSYKRCISDVDIQVAARVRLRRIILGMSQEKLGEALGISFQQLQKYERGLNRISSSRIFDLAQILDVPVDYFFNNIDHVEKTHISTNLEESSNVQHVLLDDLSLASFLENKGTSKLIRDYYRIKDVEVRLNVLRLIKAMASKTG